MVPATGIPVVILELIPAQTPTLVEGVYLLDPRPTGLARLAVTHDNFTNRMVSAPAMFHSNFCPINFVGRIEAYRGVHG